MTVDQCVTSQVSDLFLPLLLRMLAIASREITSHVNDRGLCTVCGSAWPSDRAVVTEHNLAAL